MRAVVDCCRQQRIALLLEKEQLRASALLRDQEPKLRQSQKQRRQVERVVRRLLATVPRSV